MNTTTDPPPQPVEKPRQPFRTAWADRRAIGKADTADAGTYLREVTGRPERRNTQNQGRRHGDNPSRSAGV
jgi:hypothetical protein